MAPGNVTDAVIAGDSYTPQDIAEAKKVEEYLYYNGIVTRHDPSTAYLYVNGHKWDRLSSDDQRKAMRAVALATDMKPYTLVTNSTEGLLGIGTFTPEKGPQTKMMPFDLGANAALRNLR